MKYNIGVGLLIAAFLAPIFFGCNAEYGLATAIKTVSVIGGLVVGVWLCATA